MTEKGGSSNSDLDMNQIMNNLIQFQNDCNKLQNEFLKQKEKTATFDNEMKILKKEFKEDKEQNVLLKEEYLQKYEKLKLENKNEIEETKQILEEKIKEMEINFKEEKEKYENKNNYLENEIKTLKEELNKTKQINQSFQTKNKNEIYDLKKIIIQKDEKINSLDEQIKQVNVLFDKKFITFFLGQINDIKNFKQVSFVQIKNKWKDIGGEDCCTNKCINTDKPVGNCIEGNGFINIINDENIKYINRVEGKDNRYPFIYTENSFMKPRYCLNHNLFYFEYKCKFEGKNKWMFIGLKNCNSNKYIYYCTCYNKIYNEKNEGFKVQQNIWNDNDIFGCGLVYPPNNNKNENPYVFFTKNGKQVGKALLLKENFDLYKPFVELYCCSVEANFGNDLTTKPFSYDISEKAVLKEFYYNSDLRCL